MPFIRRELQAVTNLNYQTLVQVEAKIIHDIKFTGLPQPGRCQYLLDAFDGNQKFLEIFCHELLNFAASPYETVQAYDDNAIYATLEDGLAAAAAGQRSNTSPVIVITDGDD